ncbi:hypothetical protein ACP26F_00750 [Franconibacter pulveris 1160]|uniref:hypothetical protein n=1 Tax=Franconibacter TaxID=1649295 RepID=UPI0012686BE1|nr:MULTISPECIES: hypothetical protein [Franconibacter]MCK1970561.1 hypothetical protein [Franconibacter sp. IITDAS19]
MKNIGRFTEKLLSICSDSQSSERPESQQLATWPFPAVKELISFLETKNGFYGFESALHLFPLRAEGSEVGLISWKQLSLWIEAFNRMASEALFFAEDMDWLLIRSLNLNQ